MPEDVRRLKSFTMARVGLGRTGNSVATADLLDFQLAHARARDAVRGAFDPSALAMELRENGLDSLAAASAARTRDEYLRRPDLGRRLDAPSARAIQSLGGPFDIVFVIADGLTPLAVQNQAVPLLTSVIAQLDSAARHIAPIVIVMQGRVGLSDEIGALARAALGVILIGERPGLSSFDSMGVYLTWSPRPGRSDADRNCISNIRPEGLTVGAASELLLLLIREARSRQLSGVALKPEMMARIGRVD
jgi:ethanolamine ammonia-lyase small subunit